MAGASNFSLPMGNHSFGVTLYRFFAAHWRIVLSVWLLCWVMATWLLSLRWQQVNDPAQLHYACFLMDHGMSPYRDLIEMNMPGTYLTNWTVMHTLGGGSLAWRLFDIGLMLVAAWAMLSIARPHDWFAGALAATMLIMFHARDGAMQLGQRDLIIAIMLVCAHAFLFRALRSGSLWPMIGFGLTAGYAATIKPFPAPYILLLLVLAALRFRRSGGAWIRATLLGAGAMAIPGVVVLVFLVAKHSLADFLWVVRWTLPYYAPIDRYGWGWLFHRISPSVWGFVLIAALIFVFEWKANDWRLARRDEDAQAEIEGWEMRMLALGMFFGAASYFVQGKGTPYHRYPFFAFLFLWSILYIVRALRRQGIERVLAVAGVAFGLILTPSYARELHHEDWSPRYIDALTADLNHLGGPALSGKVQCITTYPDCHTVLYRMRLVQSTGLFYDFLIFGPEANPSVQHWRAVFQRQLEAHPPDVFVVHSGLYPYNDGYGYAKLMEWPAFGRYFEQNYVLYADRSFPPNITMNDDYRIYVRKGFESAAGR